MTLQFHSFPAFLLPLVVETWVFCLNMKAGTFGSQAWLSRSGKGKKMKSKRCGWVLNQKYGKTTQIINFNRVFMGFPLFSPSILGGFPPIFGNTHVIQNGSNTDEPPRRFGHAFVEKLAGAVFPSTLRSLKFGDNFNQMLGVLFFC